MFNPLGLLPTGKELAEASKSKPIDERKDLTVTVAQTVAITASTDQVSHLPTPPLKSSRFINLIVDDFKQLKYTDAKTGAKLALQSVYSQELRS